MKDPAANSPVLAEGRPSRERKSGSELSEFLAELEKVPETERKRRAEEAKEERVRGNERVAAHDYEDAVRCYERSIKLDPSEAATYSNRALAYLRLGSCQNAVNDADAAVELNPGYLKAYHRRAEARLGLEQYQKAWEDISAIVRIEPANASVRFCLHIIG